MTDPTPEPAPAETPPADPAAPGAGDSLEELPPVQTDTVAGENTPVPATPGDPSPYDGDDGTEDDEDAHPAIDTDGDGIADIPEKPRTADHDDPDRGWTVQHDLPS